MKLASYCAVFWGKQWQVHSVRGFERFKNHTYIVLNAETRKAAKAELIDLIQEMNQYSI